MEKNKINMCLFQLLITSQTVNNEILIKKNNTKKEKVIKNN